MLQKTIIFVVLLGVFKYGHGRQGFKGDQEWGHVNVREGANMFYWLHYTTANVSSYFEKPLLIWIHGGPGVSSSGYGNFEEIGPFDLNLTNRKHTLVKDYNVLFIDSPVETGFSFTYHHGLLPKTDGDVAKDLLQCIKGFLKKYPKFVSVPTYVIGQSYGGKIAAYLASEWLQYEQYHSTIGNLTGVALISAWISPVNTILSWAPYLYYQQKLITKTEFEYMNSVANKMKSAAELKNWKQAFKAYANTLETIPRKINIYNVKSKNDRSKYNYFEEVNEATKILMESKVKAALNLSSDSSFIINSSPVKRALFDDFLKPVTDKVEYLLNNTNIKVFVLNGLYDLVVSAPGTVEWFHKLRWKEADKCLRIPFNKLIINNIPEGYVFNCGKIKVHLVDRAGHTVPADNPVATEEILKDLTSSYKQRTVKNEIRYFHGKPIWS